MKEILCAYCGKDTYDVDIEYLIGGNHLSCVLMDQLSDALEKEKKMNKKKPIEISNWSKLVGNKFDVMGASFIIMDAHNDSIDEGNVYTAWINCDDTGHEVLARVTLFSDNMDMQVKVCAPIGYDATMTPYDLSSTITKNHISNPSIFIQTIAEALLSDPTTRDILSYVSRKQDENRRKKGTYRYTPTTGLNGSSGNNLW
jgi:hypothetical protein